jgi:hypothetical protein
LCVGSGTGGLAGACLVPVWLYGGNARLGRHHVLSPDRLQQCGLAAPEQTEAQWAIRLLSEQGRYLSRAA